MRRFLFLLNRWYATYWSHFPVFSRQTKSSQKFVLWFLVVTFAKKHPYHAFALWSCVFIIKRLQIPLSVVFANPVNSLDGVLSCEKASRWYPDECLKKALFLFGMYLSNPYIYEKSVPIGLTPWRKGKELYEKMNRKRCNPLSDRLSVSIPLE